MKKLYINEKINKNGFMLACDTIYFNKWAKILYFSIKKHASWAHVHFHVFDPTNSDINWLSKQTCSFSVEVTPDNYCQNQENKIFYWSAARYMRFTEIYEDDTVAIDLDVDSVMIKDLPQEEFLNDLKHSWVPVAPKRETMSLCSAVGFGKDTARYILRDKLKKIYDDSRLTWALDQTLCDEMLNNGEIKPMDLRYTYYKFGKGDPYIWTGKGDRVNKEPFVRAQEEYIKFI